MITRGIGSIGRPHRGAFVTVLSTAWPGRQEVDVVSGAGLGILVVQLGTPDEPTVPALRRYLAEFLSDRRVVDLPRAVWLPILHLRVLRTRPARSARLYAKIWTPEGSPLAVMTHKQAALLRQELTATEAPLHVAVGMRYGKPSIQDALEELRAVAGRLLVVPMLSAIRRGIDRVHPRARAHAACRLASCPGGPDGAALVEDSNYLDALADVARRSLADCGWTPDRYIVSFMVFPSDTPMKVIHIPAIAN